MVGDGLHHGILEKPWPGARAEFLSRRQEILWHKQTLCGQQGYLWERHPTLETSRLSLLFGSSLSVLRFWTLQGTSTRVYNAECLRARRYSASEIVLLWQGHGDI